MLKQKNLSLYMFLCWFSGGYIITIIKLLRNKINLRMSNLNWGKEAMTHSNSYLWIKNAINTDIK